MAKSKYAPALFEVIGKKDEKAPALPLPKWWRRKDAPASPVQPDPSPTPDSAAAPGPDAGETTETPPAGPQAIAAVPDVAVRAAGQDLPYRAQAAAPPAQAAPPPVRPVAPPRAATTGNMGKSGVEVDEERPPLARIHNGRVELSLNPVNAAIVGGILLLTLFLTYQVGRGFSPAAQTSAQDTSLEEAKKKQADSGVLAVGPGSGSPDRTGNRAVTPGSGSTAGTPAGRNRTNPPPVPAAGPSTPPGGPAAAGSVQRVPGLTYVLLESFKREDKAEAEQIRQWLKTKHNVDTTVEANGEKWQLVSTQGFEYGKEAEKRACSEFVLMVKTWGKEYKAEYKSNAHYDMRDPGFKLYRAKQ